MKIEPAPRTWSRAERKKSKKGLVAALCVLAVVIVAGTAGFLVWSGQKPPPRRTREREAEISALIDTDTFYHGIVVDGIDLGGMTMDEAREASSLQSPPHAETLPSP